MYVFDITLNLHIYDEGDTQTHVQQDKEPMDEYGGCTTTYRKSQSLDEGDTNTQRQNNARIDDKVYIRVLSLELLLISQLSRFPQSACKW